MLRTAVALVGNEGVIRSDHLPDDFLDEMAAVAASVRVSLDVLPPDQAGATMGADSAALAGAVAPLPASAACYGSDAATLPSDPPVAPPQLQSLAASRRMQDVALDAMAAALRQCRGNVSAAAKMLGVSRNTIYRKKDLLPEDVWS